METSTRRGIDYPSADRSDRPDLPLYYKNIVDASEEDAVYVQGTDAARLLATHYPDGGLFWWTTDTLKMWYDDGTNWNQVGDFAGKEIDYAQITSDIGTTSLTASAAINGNSKTYDGAKVKIEVFACKISVGGGSVDGIHLYKDGSEIASLYGSGAILGNSGSDEVPGLWTFFDTPSAGAHIYSVYIKSDGANTTALRAGAGGAGAKPPAFIRSSKA